MQHFRVVLLFLCASLKKAHFVVRAELTEVNRYPWASRLDELLLIKVNHEATWKAHDEDVDDP